MFWVWLDKDITLYRTAKAGSQSGGAEITDGSAILGNTTQNLYEVAPDNVFSPNYRGKAVGVVHDTVNMSLKAGWNQLVSTSSFSDGLSDGWDYRCVFKLVRVWHGYMGPFNTFDVNNPNPMTLATIPPNFNTSQGWAYHNTPKNVKPGPYEDYTSRPAGMKRQYVDEDGKKYIPWMQVE
jgi:hypothetical protein